MVIFGVETDNVQEANDFIVATDERINNVDIARNPFNGYAKIISKDSFNTLSVVKMVPLWPNFGPWIALFSLMPILIFGWLSPLTLSFPLIFLLMSFFWSETFFVNVFMAGIKKAGYKGKVKKIKKDDLIDVLIERL